MFDKPREAKCLISIYDGTVQITLFKNNLMSCLSTNLLLVQLFKIIKIHRRLLPRIILYQPKLANKKQMVRKSCKISLSSVRKVRSSQFFGPTIDHIHFDMQIFVSAMVQQIIEARILNTKVANQTQSQLDFFTKYQQLHTSQQLLPNLVQDQEPKSQSLKFLYKEFRQSNSKQCSNFNGNIFKLTTTDFCKQPYRINKKSQTLQTTLINEYRSVLASPKSKQKEKVIKIELNQLCIPTQKRIIQQLVDRQVQVIRNFKLSLQSKLNRRQDGTKLNLQSNQSKIKSQAKSRNPFNFDNDGNQIQVRHNPIMNNHKKQVLVTHASVIKKDTVKNQISPTKFRIYSRNSFENIDHSKFSNIRKAPKSKDFCQLLRSLKLSQGIKIKQKMEDTQTGFLPAIKVRS